MIRAFHNHLITLTARRVVSSLRLKPPTKSSKEWLDLSWNTSAGWGRVLGMYPFICKSHSGLTFYFATVEYPKASILRELEESILAAHALTYIGSINTANLPIDF